jgi:hypothetical protein
MNRGNRSSNRSNETIVRILPSTQTVDKGVTFIVSVYVEPGEPIIGIKFDKLYFNATLIQANYVSLEGFFDPYEVFYNDGDIDNVSGEITNVYEVTVPIINVSTEGYFCNISFTAQQIYGVSELDLEGVIVPGENGTPIPVTVFDGEVVIADIIPPIIAYASLSTSIPLDTEIGWENFSCVVTDNVAVDEVKLIITGDATTEIPLTAGMDNLYYYNTTLSIADEYTYYFWADDVFDNENMTLAQPFYLPLNQDVDEGGKVHFLDLTAITVHYNEAGPPGWIREDVNNNGMVHFLDLVNVSLHYNQEWK